MKIVCVTEVNNSGNTRDQWGRIVDLDMLPDNNPYKAAVLAAMADKDESAEIDYDNIEDAVIDAARAKLPAHVESWVTLYVNY